jgi:hypothetical protein
MPGFRMAPSTALLRTKRIRSQHES